MNTMTPKILVGYRTRPVPLAAPFEPEFTPPANYKDAAKIAEWLTKQREQFYEEAAAYPYLSTLDEVFCVVLGKPKEKPGDPDNDVGQWVYREPGSGKPSIASAMRTWLYRYFGRAWEYNEANRLFDTVLAATQEVVAADRPHEEPPVSPVFIGFDPKAFLKIWGLELSMPGVAQPLAPAVWYGSNNYKDIRAALIPSEAPHLDLRHVLKLRGIDVTNWTKPGVNPQADVTIITQAADQLGFLRE